MKSGNLHSRTAAAQTDSTSTPASDAAPGSSVKEKQPAVPEAVKEEVPYGAVRDDVQNGDILCFKGKGFVSGAIRTLTKSEYSHVGLLYLFEGRKYCLEAVGHGVRLVLLSELVKNYHGGIDYFETLDVTKDQRCGAISFGFQQLGKLYDKAGIVRFFWYIVSQQKPAAEVDDIWFCSEIVCEAYRRQQVDICPTVSSYTSPHDIAKSSRVRYRYTLKPGE
jgi:uncharacterized protein YycO